MGLIYWVYPFFIVVTVLVNIRCCFVMCTNYLVLLFLQTPHFAFVRRIQFSLSDFYYRYRLFKYPTTCPLSNYILRSFLSFHRKSDKSQSSLHEHPHTHHSHLLLPIHENSLQIIHVHYIGTYLFTSGHSLTCIHF